MAVEIPLEDVEHLRLLERRAVGGILQRLPHDIAAGVVELVLDDHQLATLVERQQVEPLARVGKPVELLLDDQQLFAECVGGVGHPLLEVFTLAQTEVGELLLIELEDPVL